MHTNLGSLYMSTIIVDPRAGAPGMRAPQGTNSFFFM